MEDGIPSEVEFPGVASEELRMASYEGIYEKIDLESLLFVGRCNAHVLILIVKQGLKVKREPLRLISCDGGNLTAAGNDTLFADAKVKNPNASEEGEGEGSESGPSDPQIEFHPVFHEVADLSEDLRRGDIRCRRQFRVYEQLYQLSDTEHGKSGFKVSVAFHFAAMNPFR
ncbi:hypothetical protein LINPERHAP2_LOCUS3235 [Linum perenne]